MVTISFYKDIFVIVSIIRSSFQYAARDKHYITLTVFRLVRASTRIPSSNGHYLVDHQCKRPTICQYCCHLNKTSKVTFTVNKKTVWKEPLMSWPDVKLPPQTFMSKIQVNCQSSNLIYLITCTHCQIQYVGQTKNRLLIRFQGRHAMIPPYHDIITNILLYPQLCSMALKSAFSALLEPRPTHRPVMPKGIGKKRGGSTDYNRWSPRALTLWINN